MQLCAIDHVSRSNAAADVTQSYVSDLVSRINNTLPEGMADAMSTHQVQCIKYVDSSFGIFSHLQVIRTDHPFRTASGNPCAAHSMTGPSASAMPPPSTLPPISSPPIKSSQLTQWRTSKYTTTQTRDGISLADSHRMSCGCSNRVLYRTVMREVCLVVCPSDSFFAVESSNCD